MKVYICKSKKTRENICNWFVCSIN